MQNVTYALFAFAFAAAALIACGTGMTVEDLSNINEDSLDSIPYLDSISENSTEPLADGCLGVKKDVVDRFPKNQQGAKAVSKICSHVNRKPCNSEDECIERCKAACKEDALAKALSGG